MKKNCSIIILLLLAGMPLWFSAYTVLSKMMIEYAMERKMETEHLQTVTTEIALVVWLKKNKEVLINGEAFDVKRFFISGNKITLWGLYDLREKALKKKLQEYHDEKDNSTSANNSVLLLLFAPCTHTINYTNVNVPSDACAKQVWGHKKNIHSNPHLSITVPPPRFS